MKPERYNSDRSAHLVHLNYLIEATKSADGRSDDRRIEARDQYRRLVPEEGGGIDPRSALASVLAFYHQTGEHADPDSYVDGIARRQEARSHSATTKRHYRRDKVDAG